jgi:hypothetical protein
MNYEPLMQIVVDALWFFELSPAEAVDDDAAVEMIELIATNLQALDTAEKENFLAYVARRAEEAKSVEERQFLQSMPLALGLETETP